MSSPTARTLAALRAQGYLAEKVEQTIPHTYIKRDLFGYGDIVACRAGEILIVQATSGANVSARVQKIQDECLERAIIWLQGGGRIQVWGWRKVGDRGQRKLWQARIVALQLDGRGVVCEAELGA